MSIKRIELIDCNYITKLSIMPIKFLRQIHLTNRGDTLCLNMEGKKVPQVTFRTRQGDQWVDVTTSELFDNKTVVVFSLPGAFTPTCSSSHLPRYNELAPSVQKTWCR